MATYYEWVVEHVDDHGDIIDVFHGDQLSDLLNWTRELPDGVAKADVGLVQNVEVHWQVERAWAYVENGALPDKFDNGRRVPKQFVQEYAKCRPNA